MRSKIEFIELLAAFGIAAVVRSIEGTQIQTAPYRHEPCTTFKITEAVP